ncbi:hypothetical protein [Azospirillum sp. TSO22-1]|uniref:hypothetical protein n=1 Tax=Azospirillum sp. TSO22-1 TaxID=716789 RepID=UPI000D60CB95|nr:hypothetical protein [Azospirillum sp. TSO22-1]PWC32020.1 hypothetical protein TSO221_31825 [Azospirillum sp. TSO22-1]
MGKALAAGAAAVWVVMLAGCADGTRTQMAQQAQTGLVGMPKSRLLSCAGVPARQAAAEGREYYTYVHGSGYGGGPWSSLGVAGGSGGGGVGLGIGFPLGGSAGYCEATFVLQNDVVRQVNYPAGANLPDCGSIVQNCMGAS